MYKRYGGKKKIFRGVDRIKLIRSILEVKKPLKIAEKTLLNR